MTQQNPAPDPATYNALRDRLVEIGFSVEAILNFAPLQLDLICNRSWILYVHRLPSDKFDVAIVSKKPQTAIHRKGRS